ncbi:profilin-1-like [Physella acuta]|uniref:profilin-1-like n=1 Tax=Physella acuta TaxID=109671 RepID=UPI0027DEA57F|nr:profilin-1-like [Physella acuta]
MSAWDAYITNMQASGLQICGIYGLEGGPWAQSPQMKASQQEVAAIVTGIQGQQFPNGITIGGLRYTVIRMLPDTVTAKCRGAEDTSANYLVHAALAKTCIIIGGMCGPSERDTTKLVEDIRDYLVKSNY